MNRERDNSGLCVHHTLGLLALGAAFLASCQVLAPRVERPDWRVGDEWTYRFTTTAADGSTPLSERLSRQTIAALGEGRVLVSTEEEESGHTTRTNWVWNADGEVLSRSMAGQPTHTYDPPLAFHRWPSEPGQSWSFSFHARTDDGESLYSRKMEFKVVGWETISVPAGTYRALKSEIHAFSPDGELTGVATSWFAPQVKRRVRFVEQTYVHGKHTSTIQHELLSYGPGGKTRRTKNMNV